GQLGERDRVLLSIAERAGAVELEPAGADGLLVRLTGQGSPRRAQQAIQAARDRGWESYRSIERFSAGSEICRRRQILDHFGDEEQCRASGRCCDVCDPDLALDRAVCEERTAPSRRRGRSAGASGRRPDEPPADPVDEEQFEKLRAWRWERAEGKPAFTVAANRVLEEVLRRRPRNAAELIEIKGIGEAFCEKHGDSLLEAVRALSATGS
ncbi:MAG: ATP-dependent helicase, RecQ family, partial [Solirubrobacterales bacterium]|nr:ATP-dependent helicase, RecQ family [Solirubrobacterales bacterium]